MKTTKAVEEYVQIAQQNEIHIEDRAISDGSSFVRCVFAGQTEAWDYYYQSSEFRRLLELTWRKIQVAKNQGDYKSDEITSYIQTEVVLQAAARVHGINSLKDYYLRDDGFVEVNAY